MCQLTIHDSSGFGGQTKETDKKGFRRGDVMLTHMSLFTGAGAFDLAAERVGITNVAMVETDKFARTVLSKRFPNVRLYGDIQDFGPKEAEEVGRIDILSAGFPCQDVSENHNAGKGLRGERSSLFFEAARVLRLVRPQVCIMENVSNLLARGMGEVLGELAESGYDAEWSLLSAASFGACHIRERVVLLAYPAGNGREELLPSFTPIDRQKGWPNTPLDSRGDLISFLARQMGGEPPVFGIDDGIPDRVVREKVPQRLQLMGNSVYVPKAEWIMDNLARLVR